MPSSLKTAYNKVKQPIRAPAWTYTGIILALGIIATGFISDQRETVRTASRVVAPEAGDVLAVKRGGGTYTLYKVQNTTADSAYLLMNQFETDQESGLNVIKGKGPSAYLPAPVGFSRKDLKIWLDQGLIVGVER
ncbi:hypothetical protein MKQ70_05605 [Chitinophaga sedimenti]|uniref:hypothetical protein n=1 Tax=Chitinophaga sedimenti TaxID=2033606 RepID=UPI002002D671|nr:hypothetical protein [Chitinophaga sedimenti]MCK7554507.1 hypothetical protein [Chitinophaga sedimenti]